MPLLPFPLDGAPANFQQTSKTVPSLPDKDDSSQMSDTADLPIVFIAFSTVFPTLSVG